MRYVGLTIDEYGATSSMEGYVMRKLASVYLDLSHIPMCNGTPGGSIVVLKDTVRDA